jgi:carboxyl-terminal processing protease
VGTVADQSELAAEMLAILRRHYADPSDLARTLAVASPATFKRRTATDPSLTPPHDVVVETISKLRLSHTRRYTGHEIDYYHLLDTYSAIASFKKQVKALFPGGVRYPGIGVLPKPDNSGRWFVSAVVPSGPAYLAGILAGDELVGSDNDAYRPVAAFDGKVSTSIAVHYRREAGEHTRTAMVRPVLHKPCSMFLRATRPSARRIEASPNRIFGYAHPWSLAGARYWQTFVDSVWTVCQDCDGLILDLRDSIGGADPAYADFFIGASPELRLFSPRGTSPTLVNRRWRKRLIVLVDGSTRSGNEVLAYALQRAGVPLVGTRTAGAVSAATPFLLSDHSLLLVATHLVEVDGVALEGRGVVPDHVVERDLAFSAGTDAQMNAAIGVLVGS